MYHPPGKKFLWVNLLIMVVLVLYLSPQIITHGVGATIVDYWTQPLNLANLLLAILIIANLAPFLFIRGLASNLER